MLTLKDGSKASMGIHFFKLQIPSGPCRQQPIGRPQPTAQNESMSITAGRFGKRLRQLRIARGLSQIEMAHQFGIDRGHISEMESGKKNVCLPMLEVLARGFRVTISELMKGV
jgi:DNA-binding XRE family transcriptional regulator